MALVTIFRSLRDLRSSRPFELKAFVVDHLARAGSSDEARRVSEWVREAGIQIPCL